MCGGKPRELAQKKSARELPTAISCSASTSGLERRIRSDEAVKLSETNPSKPVLKIQNGPSRTTMAEFGSPHTFYLLYVHIL